MFGAILATQWKWARLGVVLAFITAFTLPVLSVQGASAPIESAWQASEILDAVQQWSVWYPFLALAMGLLAATSAWGPDHRGQHVYALTLPVPRWHYVLLRFGAGAVLLAAPAVALWIGAILAAGMATVPEGMSTYATALSLRFALALFVAYAVFFAISSGTTRTAAVILGVVGTLVILQFMFWASDFGVELLADIFGRFVYWPGPFEIFTGRWMLIDV